MRTGLSATPSPGQLIEVGPSGDLQGALDRACLGDVVELTAGATYRGAFVLPAKTCGAGWITVRTSGIDDLPRPGARVTEADATAMAHVVSAGGLPAISTAPGAHHYRLVGLEVTNPAGVPTNALVALGGTERRRNVPHHLVVDRSWLHGASPTDEVRRCLLLNARAAAVIDSRLDECHATGVDSQAVLAWNTPGPLKIENNYLEGASENILLGGADPRGSRLVPSDVVIRRNHIAKPRAWQAENRWDVKNLLELKLGRRVLIEGNVLENNWADAQVGFAILLSPRNQDGAAPWSEVSDLTIRANRIEASPQGIDMSGSDDNNPSRNLARVLVADNLWRGMTGRVFQLINDGGPASHVFIDHNTVDAVPEALGTLGDATDRPSVDVEFTANIAPSGTYGFFGSGVGDGRPAFNTYLEDWTVRRNVVAGNRGASWPRGNWFPASLDDVGFVDRAGGDYRLAPGSPYARRSLGADIDVLEALLAGVAP